jgi:hypothetical protein
MNKITLIVTLVGAVLLIIGVTGCITDAVKERTITGKIIAVDVSGVPAFPFVVVAFDNGETVSPIEMRSYSILVNNLNKNVTVVFHSSKDNSLWYDVKSVVEG